MNASLEVIGLSNGDVPSYHESETCSTSQRLHCRVLVAQETSDRQYFDSVTVTLQGSLYSKIGTSAAVENLLRLSEVRQQCQFERTPASKEASEPSIHTELVFELPEVIPSLNLAGTTFVTRSTALADRHQVFGYCHIRYWLEAEFKSNTILTRRLVCPVDFSKLMHTSRMTVLATGRASCTRQPIWVQRRGLSFRRHSKFFPAMTLEVPLELGIVASTQKMADDGHQRLRIPLTISTPRSSESSILLSEGISKLSVRSKWHTSKSFGTSRLATNNYSTETMVRKASVVRQETNVSFPPFFEDQSIDQSLYSSTACLDLVLPGSISDSSIKTDLVSICYELQLEASFNVRSENGKSVPCMSKMRIPLRVHMT